MMTKPPASNLFRLMQPSQRILARLRKHGVDTSRTAAVREAMAKGLHLEKKNG